MNGGDRAASTKQGQFSFTLEPTKYYPGWGFRPNTPMFPMRVNFIFMNGGMGDYITWVQAIRWLASEATWIQGTLVIPTYFRELADYWLKPFPEWHFADYVNAHEIPKMNDTPFRGPVELNRESLNATGAHLSTCGWVYFTNKECAPEGWDYYPQFKQADLDALELPPKASSLESKKYAVITTGITTNSRIVPKGAWNDVIEYVVSLGLTPVFLGKAVTETGNTKNIHTKWEEGLRFDLGVDMRDQTSLLQAASIMSRAAVVIGHDNGLLHLAGCTSVPIVFGYNIASPEHREPKRPVGKTYNVILAPEELACYLCQSKTNFVLGFNFRECFYKDLRCMDLLFAGRGAKWKKQIDSALREGVENPAL